MTAQARVRVGNEAMRSLGRRHPWVFVSRVAAVEGAPAPGDTVEVVAPDGEPVGWGAWSPTSQIAIRMWSFDPEERIDGAWLRRRLERAIAARAALLTAGGPPAVRLVNAESDGLPGMVVDRYGEFVVCQVLSVGAERWRLELAGLLLELTGCAGVYERSDADVRAKEGLEPRRGAVAGAEPPEWIEVDENGLRFLVDVRGGHKTGFYLDQRDNRAAARAMAAGAEVLNCFAYTGAFGVAALAGGAARVTNVESSAGALELAGRHLDLNGFAAERAEQVEDNVFEYLRRARDGRRSWDVIVLDPPKFAESKAQVDRAARAYKDVNLLAFKLLRPGGRLLTFSCSGAIAPDLFAKIVADAALDARREAVIVARLQQAADHPVGLAFPEGAYLKGLVCRVAD